MNDRTDLAFSDTWGRWTIGLYLALHGALALFNLSDAQAMLRGDRGIARFEKSLDLIASGFGALPAKLLHYGMPGDYLLHTALYAAGGAALVILVQVLAGLLNLIWAMRLARLLGAAPRAASVACLLLVLLPGSLMHPHVYVTESFYSAALTGGVYSLARYLQTRQLHRLWIGFLALTFATWLRPQGAVLVALVAGLLWLWRAAPRPQLVMTCVVAATLSIWSWIGWRYVETGEIGIGAADYDLPTNFKLRADRIANIDSIPGWKNFDVHTMRYLRMPAGEFAQLVREHPKAAVKTYVTDAVNLAANPGSNAFLGMFLGVFEQNDDQMYWMKYLDREGPLGLLKALLQQPLFLFGLLGYALLHLCFYGLALVGLIDPRARSAEVQARHLLIAIVVAQLLICFLSGTVRWTYRAPVEPLIAGIVALALTTLWQRWSPRRARRASPA